MAARRFLGLDGLRGVCALSVLLYHSSNFFCRGGVLQHGYLAVDVFFILSGFVIALNYEEKLKKGGSALEFLRSRGRRLFPTYWLGATLNLAVFLSIAVMGLLFVGDSWWMIWLYVPLATLLMMPDFITPDGTLYPGMEGVTWSLFLEWVAYIGYAVGGFRCKTATLVMIGVCGWILMAIAGSHSVEGWSGGGTRPTLFNIGLLRCIPAFAAGIVLYRIHRHNLFSRLPVVRTEILLVAWIAVAAVPATGPTPIFDAMVVPLFCPVLIALLIRADGKSPGYYKWLGALSYPLYVAHPGIVLLAHYTTVFGRFDRPHPLNGLLVIALCVAAAWLIMEAAARIKRKQGSGLGVQPSAPKLTYELS
ncbi:MAG: acyltransferase family protein [Rhizomicrobium sp.]